MILATGVNGEIGGDNKLLWNIPEDLSHFKEVTNGGNVLMGMNTFKSLPFKNGLPNRNNIVLTSDKKIPTLYNEHVTYINDLEMLLEFATLGYAPDLFVIGGASVYNLMKDTVEEVILTKVNNTFEGADCFMDMSWVLDETKWVVVSTEVLTSEAKVIVYKKLNK